MKKLNINIFYSFWIKLIRGDFGLVKTFWLFGLVVNFIFLDGFSYLIENHVSDNIILISFFVKVVYNLIIFIAIWRAANKYKGLKIWKIIAYMSVVLGVLLLIIEIFINLIDLTGNKKVVKKVVPTAQIIWKKTFPVSYPGVKAIIKTNDDGFIVAGNIYDSELYIRKVDSKGDQIWKKDFNESKYHSLSNKIIKTNDGGFIVAGSVNNDWYELFVMKFNRNGKKIWKKIYNDVGDKASTIKTNNGGFIVAFGGGDEFDILKINNEGKKIWDHTINEKHNNLTPNAIAKTNDGFIVVGKYENGAFVMKFNSKGKKIWDKYFKENLAKADIRGATAITKTNDGGFLIAIESGTFAELMKINNKGKKIWIRQLNDLECGGYYPTEVNSIIKTNDGGFIVAGGTGYPGSFVAKVNNNGKTMWGNCFNKTDYYEGTSAIVKTNNGGFVIVGNSKNGFSYLMKIKYENKTSQK